jgi:CRP/FNR family transcriptional regulator
MMDFLNHQKYFDCEDCLFRTISCKYIQKEEFEELRVKSIQLKYKKGEVIFKQGAKSSYFMFLRKGIIKFNYEDDNGKNQILSINKAPALIGGANLVNAEFNLFSVCAIEDCEGCMIDVTMLTSLCLKNSVYLFKMLQFITDVFRTSIFNFINLAYKQVNGRIAEVLIFLSRNIYLNTEFILSLSRQEFAEFAGCSTENVIHTLRKFHREGVITLEGKKIMINDPERLKIISKNG